MENQVDVPVLIIGGGATGSVLAMELARHNVPFRIIDKIPGPAETSKAITVHARSMELIQRVDQNLIERFLKRGIHNQGYVLHFVKNQQRSEVRPGMDFTSLNSEFPFLLVHRQSETEQFIRDYTSQQYNRTIEWNTALQDFSQDENGVLTVTLVKDRNPTNTETLRCQYLIGCDGGNSTVQQVLKLSSSKDDYDGTRFQNLDVYLENFPDVDDFAHYCVGIDHFLMVVKLPGGFYRLLLSDKGQQANADEDFRAPFQNILDQHFENVAIGEVIWHSDWQSIVKLADRYRYGNVFLAGDCAHVHSTTGGQGLNCCMQDAFNLGWKLGMVINDQLDPAILDTYESERRPIAEQVIWAASSLHDIFMNHGRSMEERMAEMEDNTFVDKVVGRVAGLSYTYSGHLDVNAAPTQLPGPSIGDRAPNATFQDGVTMFDTQRHSAFTLIRILPLGSVQKDFTNPYLPEFTENYSSIVKAFSKIETESFIEEYGHMDKVRLYLVRPDGYLAFCCLEDESSYLTAYLESILLSP